MTCYDVVKLQPLTERNGLASDIVQGGAVAVFGQSLRKKGIMGVKRGNNIEDVPCTLCRN